MAIDSTTPRSRRALLAAAVGGFAALAAQAAGRPLPAKGASGDNFILGQQNFAGDTTNLRWDSGQDTTFSVYNGGSWGGAIVGAADYGTGVAGFTWTRWGVYGDAMGNGTGVRGGSGSRTGVYGISGDDANAPTSNPVAGVFGFCDTAGGRGVLAQSTAALALEAQGRVKFSTAGHATVPAGQKSVEVIPGINLVSSSKILCTLEGVPGPGTTIHRVAKNTTTDRFTVYLTANALNSVKVAWFVIG